MNKLLKEARLLLLDVRRNVTMPDRNEARIDKFLKATAQKATSKSKGGRLRRIRPPGTTTKEIRAAVAERANGSCEARPWRAGGHGWPDVMDHWEGGSGRRRERQSIETCWMLCVFCNSERTQNYPDASFWNAIRRAHCEHYGYPFIAHITHAQLKRSSP